MNYQKWFKKSYARSLILQSFKNVFPKWDELINMSFLSSESKIKYLELLECRKEKLFS